MDGHLGNLHGRVHRASFVSFNRWISLMFDLLVFAGYTAGVFAFGAWWAEFAKGKR